VGDTKMLINVEQLQARMDDRELRIMDCRFVLSQPIVGRESYLQGHIPGAVYADLDVDLAAAVGPGTGRHPLPDATELASTFGRLGVSADTRVVVYDETSGALAARAWWLLRWLGHEQVTLLDGGLGRWQASGGPLEEGEVTFPTVHFDAIPRNDWVLATDEILQSAERDSNSLLIDARDEARYRGEIEPIDKVAGHIPGSVNLPFQRSLNDDGTWKTGAELKKMWGKVLKENPEAHLSVMCGSGVTACHLIISARLAGIAEPRLYVGSWSEWITDPTRPIAIGNA